MITFETIRWKNFLSTGDQWTEIDFCESPSTLIVGSNGAGKSTMLDALCFALFNKPFRKINRGQLVNSINEKGLKVEVCFSIGKDEYRVFRGAKPNLFEVYKNNKMVDQEAAAKDTQKYLEQSVLKLNFKSFTQVVILGSSTFVPFMQLNAPVRREVIEDLLDIQIFSRMNNLLKDRLKDAREIIKNCEHELKLASQQVEMQERSITTLEKLSSEHKGKMEARMEEIHTEVGASQDEITELTKKIDRMQDIQAKYDEMKEMRVKITHNLEKADKDLKFYWENDNCPTCNQVLMDKTELIDGAQGRQKRFLEGLNVITDSLNRGNKQIKELQGHAQGINKANARISALQSELKKLMTEVNQEAPDIDLERDQLDKYQSLLSATESDCAEENKNYDNLTLVGTLLKDSGIKSKIISKFIPIINQKINKYLQSMDFFVNFTLDDEFNEVIKSRFRDEFSYASFSEGEKQKIDLALLFTWREIAKLKNSAATNLLILDEVFDSSLDDSSTDELLKILRGLGENVNLFVISHKGELLLDKFEKTLKFEKANDFSKLAAS